MCDGIASVDAALDYTCVVGRCNTCSKTFDMKTYNQLGECPHCNFTPSSMEVRADDEYNDSQQYGNNTKTIAKYVGIKPPWES